MSFRVVPDLERPSQIHIVGIGGAAMSAVASILVALGHRVTGSDQADSSTVANLGALGIEVSIGHRAQNVGDAELLAVSTAIRADNPELNAALLRGIPVAGRPEIMEALGRLRQTIAISGTHGKTTTTAMTVLARSINGAAPSFIVGGLVRQLGTGVRWTADSTELIVEADESDGSFLRFRANSTVVNNIEEDHLDYWGSMGALEAAFDAFVLQSGGPNIVSLDDAGARRLATRIRTKGGSVVTTGVSADADYRIVAFEAQGLQSQFTVERNGQQLVDMSLRVPGLHNARNAVNALAVAVEMGGSPNEVAAALATFTGVGRRFEWRAEVNGVTFVDDYAHLPTEVAATVQAAVGGGWDRVIAVFQPHRFTRVQSVGSLFADSFVGADLVVVTGLYAAGQAPIEGVSAAIVADAVTAAHPRQRVVLIEDRDSLLSFLADELRPGDLCLSMNAGDLTTLPDQMLAHPWARRGGR